MVNSSFIFLSFRVQRYGKLLNAASFFVCNNLQLRFQFANVCKEALFVGIVNGTFRNPARRPAIEKADSCCSLTFKEGLAYDLFCYWVNYLTYSDRNKRHNEDVTGWFEVPAQAKGAWESFAGQQLMFFVPATDTEFDNVSIMTADGTCFKQVFSGNAPLIPQEDKQRKYTACPF